MERQLVMLADEKSDWHLDENTKQRGRDGVAMARVALTAAARRTAA